MTISPIIMIVQRKILYQYNLTTVESFLLMGSIFVGSQTFPGSIACIYVRMWVHRQRLPTKATITGPNRQSFIATLAAPRAWIPDPGAIFVESFINIITLHLVFLKYIREWRKRCFQMSLMIPPYDLNPWPRNYKYLNLGREIHGHIDGNREKVFENLAFFVCLAPPMAFQG